MPKRFLNDLAYLYHGIPAPDCNLRCLFKKATEGLNDSNVADPEFWPGFMNYCKSYDYCKDLAHEKAKPTSMCVEGVQFRIGALVQAHDQGQNNAPSRRGLGQGVTGGLVLERRGRHTCRSG